MSIIQKLGYKNKWFFFLHLFLLVCVIAVVGDYFLNQHGQCQLAAERLETCFDVCNRLDSGELFEGGSNSSNILDIQIGAKPRFKVPVGIENEK